MLFKPICRMASSAQNSSSALLLPFPESSGRWGALIRRSENWPGVGSQCGNQIGFIAQRNGTQEPEVLPVSRMNFGIHN